MERHTSQGNDEEMVSWLVKEQDELRRRMAQHDTELDDTRAEPGSSSSYPTCKTTKRRVLKPSASRTDRQTVHEVEDPGEGISAGRERPQKQPLAEEYTSSEDDLQDPKQKLAWIKNADRFQWKDNIGSVGKCIPAFHEAMLLQTTYLLT
ncbi:hypothetical protein Pmani_006700 [Petrolisthes manimaculis]|uniref:Uncharacterized protein n=1 Tax=Petrolisthes manimaculis TaxID=1843537 RepID=A0AAE1ULG2_9EUCA|nr:hypothetical protein Pmani_006700 [Petrolisthes manimaculis]